MPTGVRLGVAIPQTILSGAFDARAVVGFLARAETLGFESAWVVEQILGSIRSLEPVTLLIYAAANTERAVSRPFIPRRRASATTPSEPTVAPNSSRLRVLAGSASLSSPKGR